MRFAIINDAKSEAKKGLSGSCPSCGSHVIPKCGNKKRHHWAHKGRLMCDPWWENETQWHRGWKSHFPVECQEVSHKDEATGEKHIADVKTINGWVLEFQHSYLKPEERKARNDFYKKIAWVVDGTRLKGDLEKVMNALKSGKPMNQAILKVAPDACSIFRDWASLHAPVFFDFGGSQLVLLLPSGPDGFFYASTAISKEQFITIFREPETQLAREFETFLNAFHQIVHQWNNPQQRKLHLTLPERRYIRRGPRIDYIQSRKSRNRNRF